MNAISWLLAMAVLMSGVKFYEFDVNVRAAETHDEDYEEESDEAQSTKATASLKSYRKLFMNGLELALNDAERAEDDQNDEEDHAHERLEENLIVREKDELEFECDLPEHMHAIAFDWSLNGVSLKLNDSSFLFKVSDYKPSPVDEFRVVCHFQLNHQPTVFNVSFPALTLDNYVFDASLTHVAYLKFKYEKQISILNICIVVIIIVIVILLIIAWNHGVDRHQQRFESLKQIEV